MRARRPWRSKYSESVVSPSGYISKMGVEGTMSDTGPYMMERSRKSYVAGQCTKVMSICSTSLLYSFRHDGAADAPSVRSPIYLRAFAVDR